MRSRRPHLDLDFALSTAEPHMLYIELQKGEQILETSCQTCCQQCTLTFKTTEGLSSASVAALEGLFYLLCKRLGKEVPEETEDLIGQNSLISVAGRVGE